MAKVHVASVLRPFALTAWVETNNYRREYGDTAVIRKSLAERQWVVDNPVPVCPITPEEVEEVMKARKDQWEMLQKASTTDAMAERLVFENLFLDDKGRIVVPTHSGNAGFRRARNFFAAMVDRFRLDEKAVKDGTNRMEIHGLIPVRDVTYASRAERILDQQLENEMQGIGTKKMEDLEKLRVTKDLFKEGCRESDIRKLYSSSTGQKCFGLCQLDFNFPELKILNRMLDLSRESPDWVAWGPLRHNEIGKYNQRFEADRKKREELPLKNDERGLEPLESAEVDQHIRERTASVGGDGGNAAKIMAKKDMEQGSKSHPLKLVSKTMDAVLANDQTRLNKYKVHADALNTSVEIVDAGHGKELDSIMVVAKTDCTLLADIAKAIKDGHAAKFQTVLDAINNPAPVVEVVPAPVASPDATSA